MQDIMGIQIELDDTVVTNISGKTERLVFGKVIGFTPQKVKVHLSTSNKGMATSPNWVIDKYPEQLAIVQKANTMTVKVI